MEPSEQATPTVHVVTLSDFVLASPPMGVTEVPFDLVEAKLAAPSIRRGTVAKADVIARLCERGAVRDRGRARRVR